MTFDDVEKARVAYHIKNRNYLLIAVATGVVAGCIFTAGFNYFIGLIAGVFICALASFLSLFFTQKEADAYRHAYKGYFVEQNFRKIFTNLSYAHDQGFDPRILRSTEMISTGDLYSSNDLTRASYKNVNFVHADAEIQTEHSDSDGNTHYVTIFKGRIMLFEFPKKFNFKLELLGRKFRAGRVPGKDKTTGRKMSKIATESSEFNHAFKIYAQDGFETFYLLDPARIAKFQDLAARYKNKLLIGFLDNTMLVAIDDGKDSFEPPKARKPIDEQAETTKVAKEIKVITDLVDELSLAPIFQK